VYNSQLLHSLFSQRYSYYFDVNIQLTAFYAHIMLPDKHSCHNTMWHTTHSSATRRQQSEIQYKPLRGSGISGAILHVSRVTFLWRTFHTHNSTINGRLSYFNQDETHSTWNISPLCRAKTTRYWTQAGTRSRPQGPGPQLHGGVWRIKSHGTSNIPRREEYMLLFTTPSSLQGNKFHNKD